MRRSLTLKNKTFLITGGAGGLGVLVTRSLLQAGGEVIVTCRDVAKTRMNFESLGLLHDKLTLVSMDLSVPESILGAVKGIERFGLLDGVVLNAGVFNHSSKLDNNGLETQLTANYLGNVLLMDRLYSRLNRKHARVIHVSSIANLIGRIEVDSWTRKSKLSYLMYAQSKLASLMFGLMMAEKFSIDGDGLKSVVCHPGICRTPLFNVDASTFNPMARLPYMLAQPPEQGANIILDCLLGEEAMNGEYYGPNGFFQLKGRATPCHIPYQAFSRSLREKLRGGTEHIIQERWGVGLINTSEVIELSAASS